MADKKSFLLYFDMYPSIRGLLPEQRGYLLSALFEFADAAWRENGSRESVLERFPQMSEAARMAYSFIAEAIQRDTEKWREKQARYQKAAAERLQNARQDDVAKHVRALRKDQGKEDDIWKYV